MQIGEYGSNSRDHTIADAVDTMKDMARFEKNPLSGTVTIDARVRRESTADLWSLPDICSSDGTLAAAFIFDNGYIKAYRDGEWQSAQEFVEVHGILSNW